MVMAIKAILLFASSMAPMAMGAAVNNNDECGAPDPTEEHIVVAREMSLNESMTVASEFSDIANINVPVYVHIVSKDENEHPKSRDIRAMMADMTENYKDMGFRFHGGCTGSGDMVADTPACQKTWSCDDKTKTCPGLPGNDAVHNFMAYGKCRTQFTAGQGRRARSQYRFYRA